MTAVNDDILVFAYDLGQLDFAEDVLIIEVHSVGNVALFPRWFRANVNERHTPVKQLLGGGNVNGCCTLNLIIAFFRSRD
jgi:hypothetical protein